MSLFSSSNLTNSRPAKPPVSYQAIDPLAVASVVFGGLSILAALHWWFFLLPILGAVFGWAALRRIRRMPAERSGLRVAATGLGLSLVVGFLGGLIYFNSEGGEVPYGYTYVDYEMLQPDYSKMELLPKAAMDMQDRKVYFKGYIQPRRQQANIKEFILCPSTGDCQFCIPDPRPTEKVRVLLQGDLRTNYTTRKIGVGGRFRVDPNDPGGVPYSIEADYIH